jgi:DNA-binding transcriptional ArsR family regulator
MRQRAFDALASEARREIVARLAHGPSTTPEIGRRFGFSKQALNRHLVVLEDVGLLARTLVGRVHELRLVPTPLDEVSSWIETVRSAWGANLDRLGQVLEGNDD